MKLPQYDKPSISVRELTAVIEAVEYGILVMDRHLVIKLTNRAYREIWGLDEKVFQRDDLTLRDLYEITRSLYDVSDND